MCDSKYPGFLVVGLGVGLPVGLLVASTGGAEEIEPALMSAVVVGGIAGIGYLVWSSGGVINGAVGSIGDILKGAFCGAGDAGNDVWNWLDHTFGS